MIIEHEILINDDIEKVDIDYSADLDFDGKWRVDINHIWVNCDGVLVDAAIGLSDEEEGSILEHIYSLEGQGEIF